MSLAIAHNENTSPFDSIRRTDEQGEYWLARDLMPILGYPRWSDFKDVIDKSKTSCENTGNVVTEHFSGLSLKNPRSEQGRCYQDFRISGWACFLIVFSCDARKPPIQKAQSYFLKQILKVIQNISFEDMKSTTYQQDLSGFVYLVKAENTSYFKIGKSKAPYRRLSQLQTGSPIPLTVVERVFSLDCCTLERLLHQHYEAYQVRNEWFDLPDECVKEFLSVATKIDGQEESHSLLTANSSGVSHE